MIDEATQNLAMRYVLAELDDSASAQFREALTRDAGLSRFVAELQETAAELALTTTPQTPPPALLERILGKLSE